MRNRIIASSLVTALLLMLAACHASKGDASSGKSQGSTFFEGRATVLEIHKELGYALLSLDGNDVYGFWQTDQVHGQSGSITHTGDFGSAVGQAQDPVVQHRDFPAKVGDQIAFRGMRSQGDIYLAAVRVISK